jgi:hypothetical protein
MRVSHTGTVASAAAEKKPPKSLLANRLPYECEKYPQMLVATKSRRDARYTGLFPKMRIIGIQKRFPRPMNKSWIEVR